MNDTAPQQEKIRVFQKKILEYWHQHGRKHLPWRLTRDPWMILLAEMLLRKTTSKQAQALFSRLRVFSLDGIISMELAELEHILKPIGLYKVRAAQLKEAARALLEASDDDLKSDQFLRSLPGVGLYISNMVRCGAFGHAEPALDTNMIRIIQRVFNWQSSRRRPREDRKLWEFAKTLVPKVNSREYNWGVLDLGAAVCTHRSPKCSECPLSEICSFYRTSK